MARAGFGALAWLAHAMRPGMVGPLRRNFGYCWCGAVVVAGVGAAAGCSAGGAAGCLPGDADGINGGGFTFRLTVSDTAFSPTILKAQNLANVSLTLVNVGARQHDFVVDCMPTPNPNGCPPTSCFADAAAIAPLPPDASATVTFTTPNPEGIYRFRSDLPGDTQTAPDGAATGLIGQFVVQ